MTEPTPANPALNLNEPVTMPETPPLASEPARPTQATPDQAARLAAIAAARAKVASPEPSPAATASQATAPRTKPKSSGPAPARIVAAAASVAAGIGLVALMTGAQQDVVVQVNPTPVTVQPASIIVEMPAMTTNVGQSDTAAPEVNVRVVEAAAPAERPAPQAKVVTQSEGS